MPNLKLPDFGNINWRDWKTYILILPVIIIYGLWQPLESLRSKVWKVSGWEGGLLHEVLALVTAAGAAYSAGTTAGLPLSGWLHPFGEGVVAWVITWAYIFPIIWLLLLRPAWKTVKWCWNHFDFVDKRIVGPFMKLTVNAFSWLPGVRDAWARMKDNNWFVILVGGIAYVTSLGAALYLGWQTKNFITGAVHISGFANEFVIGTSWAGGIIVAGLLGRLFLGAISEGNKEGVGAILSAAATYAAYGWLTSLSAHLGVPSITVPAAAYLIGAIYGLPVLYTIFASGFWKRVWNKVEPALRAYFDGKETPFRHVALQLVGIVLALGAAFGTWQLCGAVGLGIIVSTVIPALALLVVYAIGSEVFDQDHGNLLVDIVGSLALAVFGGFAYFHGAYVFGVYGAIAAGVITAIASFFVIPLVYTGVQWFATLPGLNVATNWLGSALPSLHKAYIENVVEPTIDKCELVYNEGYGHTRGKDAKEEEKFTAFRKLALHSTNTVVAWTLAALAYTGVHLITFLQPFEPVVSVLAGVLVLVFSVGLLGKAILNAGLEVPGALVSLLAGWKVGVLVLPAVTAGVWVAVPAGFVAAAFTMWLAFPAAMIAVRALTSWAAPWLNVQFDAVTNKAWRLVRGFWKGFEALFEFVYDLCKPLWRWLGRLFAWFGRGFVWLGNLLAPVWMAIAAIFAGIWSACAGIWKGIFG